MARRGSLFLGITVLFGAKAAGQTCADASVAAALHHFDGAGMSRAGQLIERAIEQHKCPGAVLLVGRGDEVLFQKAYGRRMLEPRVEAMTVDTLFDLASLTKPVATAASIMRLSDQGRLKLDDPVASYLPTFAANGKEKITLADLLLHIGGLPPDNDISDFKDGPGPALARIMSEPPAFAPRSRFVYSDVGYIVLGEVVRQVSGEPLDRFAADHIFRPLDMIDAGYLPAAALQLRCAATEQRDGRWMIGEVHDPRSFALGGVAGHAGVFSTARDLSRFCRMIVDDGAVDGGRVLSPAAIHAMIQPRPVPGGGLRAYGFDVDTAYSSLRGDRFERGASLGHTGFTGGAFWIDPVNRSYFILLTNRVHPDGKGDVKQLRHDVATAVGEALLGPSIDLTGAAAIATTGPASASSGASTPPAALPASEPATRPAPQGGVLCGIDVLEQNGFALVKDAHVAVVSNQTGRDRQGRRTLDLLFSAKDVHVIRIFSPEHGIDGVADEKVADATDARTGLPIVSLYGAARRPTPAMLDGVDTIVFDIQDVGVRFYTYISTMGLCMQAAAGRKVRFIVLDRPNPNTGLLADGPLADAAHLGFTAFAPLPLVHGMTVGEVARWLNVEMKINCELTVVPMENWRRRMWWEQTGVAWINPSPNLRTPTAALLYPAVALLEASNVSVGRGTDRPFEEIGAPWIDGRKLAGALNGAAVRGIAFVAISFTPASNKFAGQTCGGVLVEVIDRNAFEPARAGVTIARRLKSLYGDQFEAARVENMLQNSWACKALLDAASDEQAEAVWAADVAAFRATRTKYLLYQ